MSKIKIFHNKYYRLLVIAGVLWGFYPLIFNQSLLYLSAISLLTGRFIVGSLILYFRNKKLSLFKYSKINKKIFLYTLFASILPLSLFTVGLSLTTPIHASVLSLSLPFFVYFFSAVLFKDVVHKKVVFGGALATVGLILIIFNQGANSGGSSLLGDLMIIGCEISAALATIIARRLIHKKQVDNPDQLAFYDYSLAAVFFGIVFVATAIFQGGLPIVTYQSIIWIVIAATVGGIVPYLYFLKSAKGLPAEKLADTNYIAPVTGVIAAVVLVGASFNAVDLVGLAIVIIGLAISNNKIHQSVHIPGIYYLSGLEHNLVQKSVALEKVIIDSTKSKF